MSIRGNRRWLLWICGAGAIAALVTAMVSWKDIMVHYHLARLRQDPASLPTFLDASAGAIKKLAATVFAREPLGRVAVVSLFMDYFARACAERMRVIPSWSSLDCDYMVLGKVDIAILGFQGWDEFAGKLKFWGELHWRDVSENGWFDFLDDRVLVTCDGRTVFLDATRILALAELLVECRGASLDPPHYPRLTVEVLTLQSAVDRAKGRGEPLNPIRGPFGAPADGSIPPQSPALLISRKLQ